MDWYKLTPLWEGNKQVIEQGLPHEELSPPWQILVLGDISPTRHLQLLTGEPIEVDVINMSYIDMDSDGVPDLIDSVQGPRMRRQVWLRTDSGNRLGYAVSWWETTNVENYLQQKALPIWKNLANIRAELYRETQKVQFGNSSQLEEAFNHEGPFWGRYYYFYHQKKALTLIYEVFSPTYRIIWDDAEAFPCLRRMIYFPSLVKGILACLVSVIRVRIYDRF